MSWESSEGSKNTSARIAACVSVCVCVSYLRTVFSDCLGWMLATFTALLQALSICFAYSRLSWFDPRSCANIQAVFNEERRAETRQRLRGCGGANNGVTSLLLVVCCLCEGRPGTGSAGTCVFCLLTVCAVNEIRSISVMAVLTTGSRGWTRADHRSPNDSRKITFHPRKWQQLRIPNKPTHMLFKQQHVMKNETPGL